MLAITHVVTSGQNVNFIIEQHVFGVKCDTGHSIASQLHSYSTSRVIAAVFTFDIVTVVLFTTAFTLRKLFKPIIYKQEP